MLKGNMSSKGSQVGELKQTEEETGDLILSQNLYT